MNRLSQALLLGLLLAAGSTTAQVKIGGTLGSAPHSNALLELGDASGSTKGFILPRVSTASRPAAGNAIKGMLIFNSTSGIYQVCDGSNWLDINTGTTWNQTGNSGTTAGTHFIGTTDAVDFVGKTNGVERLRITATGNMGIGTVTPGNVVEINGANGTGTGLKLPTGAASGKILTSDAVGNALWQPGSTMTYTEIHGSGSTGVTYVANAKLTCLATVKGDNVQAIYGSSYGWDNTNKRWIAPKTGKYRVTTNGYFNPLAGSVNPRIYSYVNGTATCGIVSVTQPSGASDISSSNSAIVSLNMGDYIEWRAGGGSSARVYCDDYHTFVRVESVE